MQLGAQNALLGIPKLGTVAAVSSVILLTPTPAYALSVGEVINNVTSSPWGMFGVGCAAGAIVGGLVFGIAGSSAKHRLYDELEEISAEAQRARNSAELYRTRYESLSAQLKRSYVPTATVQQQTAQHQAAWQPRQAHVRQTYAQPAATGSFASQATTGALPRQPRHQATVQDTSQLQARAQAQQSAQVTNEIPRQDKPTGSVRDTLRRRLGAESLGDMPTINRGQAVQRPVTMGERFPGLTHTQSLSQTQGLSQTQAGVSQVRVATAAPAATGASQTATLNTTNRLNITRASIINRRVPSIDASLFPDNSQVSYTETDMFEAALSAMDENMRREQESQRQAAEVASLQRAADAASQQRAAAHVEDLVREEMERNKRAAQGDMHSRFTVYEGTGDLAVRRQAPEPEMPLPATKEA
ncbi:MAG: hypothetical protein Q4A01_05340 [Coriobacteriales bacterium]|nr:hypothetical protein [Coriobacteriales bacterium]